MLFVDDDFLISLSTTSLLEDLGHTVVTASSGSEALDVLRAGKPIDMMITDYAMPGMTGLQLAEEARALRPDLPILLATGYADLPTRAKLELPRLQQTLSAEAARRADCRVCSAEPVVTRGTASPRHAAFVAQPPARPQTIRPR